MPRAKISEFSTIAGDNTDIDGINLAEGMAPSLVNDAIRELMAQLKDFQSGAAGDNITVVGTLAAKGTSSSGADLKLYEDTDNGTNYVGFIAPASIASNVQWTLPSADGSSGQALQTNGSGTLSFATLGISAGGTGQTTANAAFNALVPSQTGNSGRYLTTDGTNTSWGVNPLGTVTSVAMSVPSFLSVSGSPITSSGTLAVSLSGTALPTTSGGTGLTSFTANGVVYASSTSALTTGSALTFDGTNISTALGGSYYSANANYGFGTPDSAGLQIFTASGDSIRFGSRSAGTFSEQMRLTSTGLGIGTSSPTANLSVGDDSTASSRQISLHGPASGTNGGSSINIRNGANTVFALGNASNVIGGAYSSDAMLFWGNAALRFYGNSAERMRLDSSGNLGLGVTPSASNLPTIEQSVGLFVGRNEMDITSNAYYNSGWKYVGTGAATQYQANSGLHKWFNAASGTAGNAISFTQALTLNTNGALVLQGGNTSASGVGITFPATQSASSDANTLDDYEEGTWTPTIGQMTGNTYAYQSGRYRKIGSYCVCWFDVKLSAAGTGGTWLTLEGLPFTSVNDPTSNGNEAVIQVFINQYSGLATNMAILNIGWGYNNSAAVYLGGRTAATTAAGNDPLIAPTYAGNSFRVSGVIHYRTAT